MCLGKTGDYAAQPCSLGLSWASLARLAERSGTTEATSG